MAGKELIRVRPARVSEAGRLTELTLRSKEYWGYSPEFMRAAQAGLTVTPDHIRAHMVRVALDPPGRPAGYYSLVDRGAGEVLLDNLFVAPEYIGQGYGQRLWRHAVRLARRRGFRRLALEAEPYAEGFYLKMGARRTGQTPSSLSHLYPGRVLPVMEFNL